MNEEQQARLDCLHMATHAAGEDCPFEYVLGGAEEFYNFVMKGFPGSSSLSVVVPFKPDGGAA